VVVPVKLVWIRDVTKIFIGNVRVGGIEATGSSGTKDGADDGAATAIAAVKPCAFGAPPCGFGA
jgi:hypothetical protein